MMDQDLFEEGARRLLAGETLAGDDLPDFRGGFNADALGLEFGPCSLDRITAHLEVAPMLHQPYGIVHGGVHASVIETLCSIGAAFWAIANGLGAGAVGVHNATDFLRSVRDGRLDAEAAPIHRGRSGQLWQAVVTRDDGKPVARGQVRLQHVDAALAGG